MIPGLFAAESAARARQEYGHGESHLPIHAIPASSHRIRSPCRLRLFVDATCRERAPRRGDYFTAPVFLGDTLAIFAARYGVHPNDIIAANRVRQRKSTGTSHQQPAESSRDRASASAHGAVRPGCRSARSHGTGSTRERTTGRTRAAAPRPASIESRSLAAPPVTSARNASVTANGLDTQKTKAPPAAMASLPADPPAAESSWYDWFVP